MLSNRMFLVISYLLLLSACTADQERETDMHGGELGYGQGNATTELKQKGWGASGQLRTGNKNDQLSLQAIFSEPGTYTVQFDMVDARGNRADAHALILWSCAGVEVSRKISVKNGASISGVGEGVRVIVTDVSTVTPSYAYDVAITVSKGVRANTQQPAVFHIVGVTPTVDAASFLDVKIPTDIGAISFNVSIGSVNGTPLADQAVQIQQRSAVGGILSLEDPRMFPWIQLQPEYDRIRIINNTVADQILFRLTLGIDG